MAQTNAVIAQKSPVPKRSGLVAQPGQGPIDLAHLGRQTLGDPGLQGEILRLFDEMLRTYYQRLEASTTRNDLMVNLHALRGAASGIGAFGLAGLAGTAEDELRAGAPVNPEYVHDIEIAVEEICTFIAPMIADDAD